eukprot:3413664-Lingulodinium_polyedra.AAC.1
MPMPYSYRVRAMRSARDPPATDARYVSRSPRLARGATHFAICARHASTAAWWLAQKGAQIAKCAAPQQWKRVRTH